MTARIFTEFIKNPIRTGAVLPSSKYLAEAICSEIDLEDANAVAEIGPGTGAFTGKIIDKIEPIIPFFVVELNPDIVATFKEKFPDVTIYNRNASELPEILEKEKLSHLDVIICGLPWASFPEKLQDEILDSVLKSLKPEGKFTSFAYLQGTLLPSARKFKKKLVEKFSSVSTSRIVWRNFPPAFTYRCVK